MLVVISIIALLIGILLPALGMAKEAGRSMACASNLRQLGISHAVYANENKGSYTPRASTGGRWPTLLLSNYQIIGMPQPSPDAVAVATLGGAGGVLDDEAVRAFVHDRVGALDVAGRSVCVLVPDATRSCPLPLLLGAVLDALEPRASRVTVVVALGTHAPMAAERLAAHVGFDQRTPAATTTALNHAWWDPATFATVGTIDDATVARLTDGRLRVGTAVRVNRAVVEHDRTLVVGPVLPHEVVGFSGGTKYLFPGVSGQEMTWRGWAPWPDGTKCGM